MSATVSPQELPRLVALTRERATIPPAGVAPCAPMSWLRGRLLPLSVLPLWQRLAYRLLRLPPLIRVEPEGEDRVADFQSAHYSRARAVAKCAGPDGYVWGIEYDGDEGERTHKSATFSRPRHPAYCAREERDAATYTNDLRECVETALAAENIRLRRKVEMYEEFVFGAARDVEECREIAGRLRT